MARIRCFLLEPTGEASVKLRRYTHSDRGGSPCPLDPGRYSYHNAFTFIHKEPLVTNEEGYMCNDTQNPQFPHDDPRWPTVCTCGYVFQDEDVWQRFSERVYRRVDTGEEMLLRDAPAGAMWEAWWMDRFYMPQGKHNLMVKTPGGDWGVDSQASNCGMPDDRKQEQHHCWVREGEPPDVTVSKNGVSCSAGAGSIQCGKYHGFLREGFLED